MAQKREARKIEEQAAEAVRRALPEEFVREIEGRDPDAHKKRRIEGGFGLQGYEAPDDIWYAATKAKAEAEKVQDVTQLENDEERYLIEEDATPEEEMGGEATYTATEEGLLSQSTLAALKNYATQNGGKLGPSRKDATRVAPTGPLVGYGSDDDSD